MSTTKSSRTARLVGWLALAATALTLTSCAQAPSAGQVAVDLPQEPEPVALVARAEGTVPVFDTPAATDPVRTLPAQTPFESPTVLLVQRQQDGWLKVLLPGRPNGGTGWVEAADVELREVDYEVRVDLKAGELTVLERGKVLVQTAAGHGRPEYPTPTGTFFVTDKLETPNPGGPYGPFALGLSARSEVLTQFMGGEGQIGLHGTNEPDTLGKGTSHGCVRVANEVIEQLADLLPLGTPVTVA